jgi:3-carboxy-cis,cis-muconate cycloisomerase
VQEACDRAIERKRPLAEMLAEDGAVQPHLDRTALDRLTDPASYLGECDAVVDRVLARVAAGAGT